MSLPFTVEQFFDVFAAYNITIWPAQLAAYLLAAVALLLAGADRRPWAGRAIAGILALYWIGIGIGYHTLHFSKINPAAPVFGGLFVLQGVLFLLVGVVRGGLAFRFGLKPAPIVGAVLIAYAMVVYPLIGLATGHSYPRTPTFGVTPCPVTIFTFGLLLWTVRPLPLSLLVIPVVWSVIGTSAAIQLGVPQDYGLLAAAIAAVALITRLNRDHRRAAGQPA